MGDAACDDGSENDFTKVSAGDHVKHPDILLVSSQSASESDQIWIVKGITGLHIFNLLIISSVNCKGDLIGVGWGCFGGLSEEFYINFKKDFMKT